MKTVVSMLVCGAAAVAVTLVLVHVGPKHTGMAIAVLAAVYLVNSVRRTLR